MEETEEEIQGMEMKLGMHDSQVGVYEIEGEKNQVKLILLDVMKKEMVQRLRADGMRVKMSENLAEYLRVDWGGQKAGWDRGSKVYRRWEG